MPCSVAPIPFAGELSYSAREPGSRSSRVAIAADVLIVDATDPDPNHPHLITHHKGQHVPEEIMADTSTGSVLNALQFDGGRGHPVLHGCRACTSNHFDIDSFTAVWAAAHPTEAMIHEAVLRRVAHIGDFRELGSLEDPIERDALALCCWLNTRERELFYRPFEELQRFSSEAEPEPESEPDSLSGGQRSKADGTLAKFTYFLSSFSAVLGCPAAFRGEWETEYELVLDGVTQLRDPGRTNVREVPQLGLVMVKTTEPTHYYALFSQTAGYDTVFTEYSGGRFEVESKYTTFIDLRSRPVSPRIDMVALLPLLNSLEYQHATHDCGHAQWVSEGLEDPGPVLRLQALGSELTHAERYGQPCDRPILRSNIPSEVMRGVLLRQFELARATAESRVGAGPEDSGVDAGELWMRPSHKWTRSAIADFNRTIVQHATQATATTTGVPSL